MNKPSVQQIYSFLLKVDGSFKTPLSKKQNLLSLAEKFYEKATLCTVTNAEEIVAMVAGYTQDIIGNMAYISVVATLPSEQGKGYAKRLMKQFLDICKSKKIQAVHLYTDKTNNGAIALYEKLGFVLYIKEDEQRPDDLHLIYCFNGDN